MERFTGPLRGQVCAPLGVGPGVCTTWGRARVAPLWRPLLGLIEVPAWECVLLSSHDPHAFGWSGRKCTRLWQL